MVAGVGAADAGLDGALLPTGGATVGVAGDGSAAPGATVAATASGVDVAALPTATVAAIGLAVAGPFPPFFVLEVGAELEVDVVGADGEEDPAGARGVALADAAAVPGADVGGTTPP